MGWRWALGTLVVGGVVGLAGCGLLREPAPPPVRGGVQVGVASWYGPGFHGNRTANGEIYDQYELTAAHPSLPLGTRAMVTNLSNGRAVEVRINDRGPFVDGRAIDLSYAAARTIGMIGPGTARVRIEVLGPAMPEPARPVLVAASAAPEPARRVLVAAPVAAPPEDLSPSSAYSVEVASLSDPGRAEHLRQVLAHRFPDAHVSRLAGTATAYYRVRIGPYPLRAVAVAHAERVSRLGYPAIILEEAAR